MPFSFIDVETRQTRRVILLFLTLVFFYFAGIFLIYTVSFLGMWVDIFSGSSGSSSASHDFSPLPSFGTILILAGIAVAAAFLHWVFSVRNMVNRILNVIGAVPVDPADRYHFLLRNVVDEVSVATGGMRIETFVVPTRSLNAFALTDLGGRAVIGVTEGLLMRLNRRQLESVIAHEAGHLVWGDCLDTTVSCSMAAVYAGLMRMATAGIQNESSVLRGRRAGLPVSIAVMAVIVVMRFLTLLLNTWLSRERETRADATAVRLTRDPLGLAEALYLISGDRRRGILSLGELSPIFIVSPGENRLEEGFGFLSDLFTTHPPVRKRLDMLLDMGHSDYRRLESGISEKPKISEDIPVAVPEHEKIWFALDDRTWQGPYSLLDLDRLQWLKPFTWVTRANDMQVKAAHEFREINMVLKKGLPGDAHVQTCPACGMGLDRVYYEGVPIWRCQGCRGVLVKSGQISRIIIRDERTLSDKVRDEAEQIKQATLKSKGRYIPVSPPQLTCPVCGNQMERSFYRALLPHRVEIDVCRLCQLLWLDEHEIEIIQYFANDSSGAGFFMVRTEDP